MSFGDTLNSIYIFWPLVCLVIFGSIVIGILFAISVGSVFLLSLVCGYYVYIWLQDQGVFSACKQMFTTQGLALKANIYQTFRIRGEAPIGPVLYIAHPHGLFSMAPFFHWAMRTTEWPADRPVRVAMHSLFFKIPILRELVEFHGGIPATESAIRGCLERGESVALLTGGIQEQNQTRAQTMNLVLRKRKGFLRIARTLNIPIVPVLTFGENELFPPIELSVWIQPFLKKWLGVAAPIPTWQSLVNWCSLLKKPLEPAVYTWIGRPIRSGRMEDVIRGIQELFKKGRPVGSTERLEIH